MRNKLSLDFQAFIDELKQKQPLLKPKPIGQGWWGEGKRHSLAIILGKLRRKQNDNNKDLV